MACKGCFGGVPWNVSVVVDGLIGWVRGCMCILVVLHVVKVCICVCYGRRWFALVLGVGYAYVRCFKVVSPGWCQLCFVCICIRAALFCHDILGGVCYCYVLVNYVSVR